MLIRKYDKHSDRILRLRLVKDRPVYSEPAFQNHNHSVHVRAVDKDGEIIPAGRIATIHPRGTVARGEHITRDLGLPRDVYGRVEFVHDVKPVEEGALRGTPLNLKIYNGKDQGGENGDLILKLQQATKQVYDEKRDICRPENNVQLVAIHNGVGHVFTKILKITPEGIHRYENVANGTGLALDENNRVHCDELCLS